MCLMSTLAVSEKMKRSLGGVQWTLDSGRQIWAEAVVRMRRRSDWRTTETGARPGVLREAKWYSVLLFNASGCRAVV